MGIALEYRQNTCISGHIYIQQNKFGRNWAYFGVYVNETYSLMHAPIISYSLEKKVLRKGIIKIT